MTEEIKALAADAAQQGKSEEIKSETVAEQAQAKEEATHENGEKNAVSDDESAESGRENGKRKRSYYDDRKPRTYVNYKDNIKSKFDHLPESSDPVAIREQVEFYFSDSNLLEDKYLYGLTDGPKNNPVSIKTLHSFKRMQHFQPYSAVVEALKGSTFLEVVGGESSNEQLVKRQSPLTFKEGMDFKDMVTYHADEVAKRSLYAKGFGEEKETTQLDIEDHFRPYGPIKSVRLRRQYPNKIFKSSVFVEFDSPETMQAFLDLETKPQWDGRDLLVMSKVKYCEGKADDINSGKIERNTPRSRGNGHRGDRGGRGRGRGGRNYDDRRGGRRERSRSRDDGDWKSRRNDFQKGGYKDRKGGRDEYGRDRKGRDRKERREPELDANGIPIVHATGRSRSRSPRGEQKEIKHKNEAKPDVNTSTSNRKRSHSADPAQEERKKAKPATDGGIPDTIEA